MSILFGGTLLLGVLIFFHELGHFVVAKACGVRVLTFSLGFGPRLVGFKIGDTDYRLSALPLGGYVRMYGDDIHEDIPEQERHRSFLHRPLAQKAAIAIAGPLANFILPIPIFFAFMVGETQQAQAYVGTVLAGEAAERAGLVAGDVIVEVDGEAVSTFSQVVGRVQDSPGKEMHFVVERAGQKVPLRVVPRAVTSTHPLEQGEVKGQIGLTPTKAGRAIDVSPGSPAARAGLRSRDEVLAVNGLDVEDGRHLLQLIDQHVSREPELAQTPPEGDEPDFPRVAPLILKVRRPAASPPPTDDEAEKLCQVTTEPSNTEPSNTEPSNTEPSNTEPSNTEPSNTEPSNTESANTEADELEIVVEDAVPKGAPWLLEDPALARFAVTKDELDEAMSRTVAGTRGFMMADAERAQKRWGISLVEGHLVRVEAGTAACALGLAPGDRIVAVDGRALTMAEDVPRFLQQLPEEPHVVGVRRGNTMVVAVFRQAKSPDPQLADFRVFGAIPTSDFGQAPKLTRTVGPVEAFGAALERTWQLIETTAKGMWMLVTLQVSFSSLGGPITIFKMAGEQFDLGLDRYIALLCFISVNLGLVNLLPVPVLDGGHLLIFAIEAVRRKELDLATKERALKIGFTMLLVLMVAAIFNDISRLFG